MSTLNYTFLEEYKHLDKLLREMYLAEKGVTNYIDEMQSISGHESMRISGWENDLRQLKRLRHIRNQLAHEVGTMDKEMCTRNDIDWLKLFCNRLFSQTDPMALLYKKKRAKTESFRFTEADSGQQYCTAFAVARR